MPSFITSSALKILLDREQTWRKKMCFSCKVAEEVQNTRSPECHVVLSRYLFYCLFASSFQLSKLGSTTHLENVLLSTVLTLSNNLDFTRLS